MDVPDDNVPFECWIGRGNVSNRSMRGSWKDRQYQRKIDSELQKFDLKRADKIDILSVIQKRNPYARSSAEITVYRQRGSRGSNAEIELSSSRAKSGPCVAPCVCNQICQMYLWRSRLVNVDSGRISVTSPRNPGSRESTARFQQFRELHKCHHRKLQTRPLNHPEDRLRTEIDTV